MNGAVRLASLVQCPVEKRAGHPQRYVALEHIEPTSGRLLPNAELEERDPSDSVRFQNGDVLFGKLRPYLRKVMFAAEDGCCSGEFLVLRPRSGLDGRFLYWVALSAPFGDWANATSYGTKMPRTSWENIRAFRFDPPGGSEQVRIADFLDRDTARIDELVDKKKRLIELLEEKRKSLIWQAVTKGIDPSAPMKDSGLKWLGDIPAHWNVMRLARIIQCLDGRRIPLSRPERAEIPGPYPYYGASRIVDWVDSYLFDEPLVLLGEDGAQLENPDSTIAQVVTGRCWVNNHAHVLRLLTGDLGYVANYLNVFNRVPFLTGATRPKLTQDSMNSIPVPFPPVAEQAEIEGYLRQRNESIGQVARLLAVQIEKLSEYWSALISAAVASQIDVTSDSFRREEAEF